MRKRNFLVIILALALTLMCTSLGLAKAKVVIKAGHAVPESHTLHYGWVVFKELIEKQSNGEIEVVIYSNAQLGGDRELIESTQHGNVSAAIASISPLTPFNKDFSVFEMLFLFDSVEEARTALDSKLGKHLLDSCQRINIKALEYMEVGFRDVSNSKHPVISPDDLKSLKMRTMESPIQLMAWKLIGTNPTPIAFSELFTALQQKTIDGQENPLELTYAMKFHELQKYFTLTHHLYGASVVMFNLDFWNDLSEAHQKLITSCMREAVLKQRDLAYKKSLEAVQLFRDYGNEITELTPEQRQAFIDKVAPAFAEVEKQVSPEVFRMAKEVLKR